jgi:hypothetical protein
VTFFSGKTPATAKIALVQDGQKFASAAKTIGAAGATASATVQSVTLTSPAQATVHYTILIGGSPILKGQKGTAVYQDGTWKVSATSFCALAALQSAGKPVPGCAAG